MTRPLDFDPYELLGVDGDADVSTIDRAYKARVRQVHPDVAGPAGLEETKRLNVAREWLLDPELRAQLPRPSRRSEPATEPFERATRATRATWSWPTDAPRRRAPGTYDPLEDDPLTFDFGVQGDRLRSFFETVRSLSDDERARVSYSLGEEEPVTFDGLEQQVDLATVNRSRALNDAILRIWNERGEEGPYFLMPRGIIFGEGPAVANAYAQWMLVGEVLSRSAADPEAVAQLRLRSTWPWQASLGHSRYGTHEQEVRAFLEEARDMTATQAERLARSWQRHMGNYVYGRPGDDWFPGAGDQSRPALVSARVAAVDATRVAPPDGLHHDHYDAFHYGLRLTAHVVALGGVSDPRRDYLRPWKDAFDASPSFADRARWGMPIG